MLSKERFKHFILFKDDKKVNPLWTMNPKISGDVKNLDETKSMVFMPIVK